MYKHWGWGRENVSGKKIKVEREWEMGVDRRICKSKGRVIFRCNKALIHLIMLCVCIVVE